MWMAIFHSPGLASRIATLCKLSKPPAGGRGAARIACRHSLKHGTGQLGHEARNDGLETSTALAGKGSVNRGRRICPGAEALK